MSVNHSPLDKIIIAVDDAISSIFGQPQAQRPYPAKDLKDAPLSKTEKDHVAGLMRINHAGEVSAQGLYQGQALTAKLPDVREQMEHAALEEVDHLAWCEQRLKELGSHTSYLNPIWYFGSFSIGAIAGLAGDKWSLGFVIETEKQVVKHLQSHLDKLPLDDKKTRAVLEQMQTDEAEHAQLAKDAGGAELPEAVKTIMGMVAKVMTTLAYKI